MTDSDKDLKLLPLCGSSGERNGSREPRFSPRRACDPWHEDLFLARTRQEDSQHGRHTPISFNRDNPQQHLQTAAGVLLCLLALVAFLAGQGNWRSHSKSAGTPSGQPELQLASSGGGPQALGQLMDTFISPRVEAQDLVTPVEAQDLVMPGVKEDLVTSHVNVLMREFGAEEYSAPSDFVHEVDRFIRHYQERDRDLIVRALGDERQNLDRVREILRRDQMPEDLAYMAVVESGFTQSSASQEGAAGFWQFTESTARLYGMKIEEGVDERLDLEKSTQAASRYLRDLILDFGSGSSVMLAMAAYNSGPEAVRRAVRNVKDPIKQRNFWYLYQTRALPDETREYVPKVFAAIIVGRNPQQFGF